MIRAVEGGSACVIFPEGRITTTGSLMKVYEGPAVIAERTRRGAAARCASRASSSRRSRGSPARFAAACSRGFAFRVLPPRRLTSPEASPAAPAVRRCAGRSATRWCSRRSRPRRIDTTLFDALLEARRVHGGGHVVADDLEQQPMTYRGLITASYALGGVLAKRTQRGRARRRAAADVARRARDVLRAAGRSVACRRCSTSRPAPPSAQAACRAAEISLVLTARRFVEKAKLEPLVTALEPQRTIVYLEDVRGEIGVLRATARRWCALTGRARGVGRERADDPAVVLFTSGSEGTPKGVVLSHRNLLANRHQLASVVDISPKDVVLNALPVFHSFGLTGGLLLPLLAGVRTFLYPSPLHYRTVPELAYGINATILFGTDTFLAGYARVADNYDFYSVRYVFAGAERVKAETRRVWFEKFGIRILEGYGATETAPALAVNTPMHFKAGTVGRLLPGIEHRLEPVDGHRRRAAACSCAVRT